MRIHRVHSGSTASGILDLTRFLAALTVFALHATANHIIPGYQAVMVFFVLSGYFVGVPTLDSIWKGKWVWKRYFIKRLTRLWIVLLPALVLTWIWATWQSYLFGATTTQGFDLGWKSFIANLFFLQGAHVPVYGQNSPLWSLSFEFWYYLLFPCIALSLWSRTTKRKLAYAMLSIVTAAFMHTVVGNRILEYFTIWMLGVLLSLMRPAKATELNRRLVSVLVLMVAVASLWVPYGVMHVKTGNPASNPFAPDFTVGLCFMMFVYIITSVFNTKIGKPSRFTKIAAYLAGFSYSLYLVHDPILNLRSTWRVTDPHSMLNTWDHLLVRVITFVVVVGYAWFVSRLTEARTNDVRRVFTELDRNKARKSVKSMSQL